MCELNCKWSGIYQLYSEQLKEAQCALMQKPKWVFITDMAKSLGDKIIFDTLDAMISCTHKMQNLV